MTDKIIREIKLETLLLPLDLDIQRLVGESCVPELHRLEQLSAKGNIGTLAENCLEALKGMILQVTYIKGT